MSQRESRNGILATTDDDFAAVDDESGVENDTQSTHCELHIFQS